MKLLFDSVRLNVRIKTGCGLWQTRTMLHMLLGRDRPTWATVLYQSLQVAPGCAQACAILDRHISKNYRN